MKKAIKTRLVLFVFNLVILTICIYFTSCTSASRTNTSELRERISINKDWKFFKYRTSEEADNLIYDIRPEVFDRRDDKVADTKPTEAIEVEEKENILKAWILPTGNDFIKDSVKKYIRPEGNPGSNFPFVQSNFDDSFWETVKLPHDWAIKGPFYEGEPAEVGGGMGRLPSPGVAWYRKKLDIPENDKDKSIFLDIDGAMSYAMVWLNGHLVGGWPYGYASWRLDITPFINFGGINQLAIRLDNPNYSARWYPGGGIYRNVWLVKTNNIKVAQYGTFITTKNVTSSSATIDLEVTIDNKSDKDVIVDIQNIIYLLNADGKRLGEPINKINSDKIRIDTGKSAVSEGTFVLNNPKLWGPPPTQMPNLYLAETTIFQDEKPVDRYETRFGIRNLEFNPDVGILVNGEKIKIQGVNQHHDLGALGAAFNIRAAERQLEILRDLGCNAIRMSHNPPAPELLELTDKMGFLVIDEIFDSWERKKTPHDFHLIFPEWYEQDIRAFIRRDRNHPSVIFWSYGNEVGEQYTGEEGAELAIKLYNIVKEEDPTRFSSASMNFAKPDMPFSALMEIINLNYQGEGIRNAPAYAGLPGINTPPLYPAFHEKFPGRVIVSSETASALSTRGTYLFPVYEGISAPVKDGSGGDPVTQYVSSYELYTAAFGSSADKVFASQDQHPYVAGEFVWTGWDYLGEPTPYYGARSSYSGIIDLAGFPKDRFYLYQSRWRPELPMVHILPHWNWPDRIGEITPVHVFTSGDEVEVFLNGKSLGRKAKGKYEYRLRWDDVKYEPGELKAVAYKNGKTWAETQVETTGKPAKLEAFVDRNTIYADGNDLAFITVQVKDEKGRIVPQADNLIEFSIEGPGEIIATDNGDPTDLVSFSSNKRKAFSGLALTIVQSKENEKGTIVIRAKSNGLNAVALKITSK
ncbi:MAG: beta-galactosidase GalB [Draconibacterium sp.]